MSFVKSIYAVELSGACNLEKVCTWCPMNTRPRNRPRGIMDERTLTRALYWVSRLPPTEVLALHIFGEPLLHPKFAEWALRFAEWGKVTMSTNGVLLDEAWADKLAKVPWAWISVSPWDPTAQAKAVELLYSRGINTATPPGATHDWAGQSKDGGKGLSFDSSCPFLTKAEAVIRWDGTLATCCISDRMEDSIGHVNDEPGTVKVRGYSICETCHLNGSKP